ncbi:MAG: DUF4143 domain-containing protein [Lachnospiraceae bacterium]|nr:DUF4143 domain-containing protein [Lachnospiraceae bacterium]
MKKKFDQNVRLTLSAENTTQKCYMVDTGLLITQTFLDRPFIENELYRAILFDELDIDEGMIMENVVTQMLRWNGHKLYFYFHTDKEYRENHMEIDFLITEKKKVAPIEVKIIASRLMVNHQLTGYINLQVFCNRCQLS